MTDANASFATRLRHARLAAGRSLGELASLVGLSGRQAIGNLEADPTRQPRPALVAALAEALDVTPAWLLGWTDSGGPLAQVAPSALERRSNRRPLASANLNA